MSLCRKYHACFTGSESKWQFLILRGCWISEDYGAMSSFLCYVIMWSRRTDRGVTTFWLGRTGRSTSGVDLTLKSVRNLETAQHSRDKAQVSRKILWFRNVTPWSLVSRQKYFRKTCSIHNIRRSENFRCRCGLVEWLIGATEWRQPSCLDGRCCRNNCGSVCLSVYCNISHSEGL
jgi:hypothetical protein